MREVLQRHKKQQQYYLDWSTGVAKRLNRAEDSVYESMASDCHTKSGRAFSDKLTGKTLEIVLGMPEERFWRLNGPSAEGLDSEGGNPPDFDLGPKDGVLKLPDPRANFFLIDRGHFELPNEKSGRLCKYRVWFEVNELIESFRFQHPPPPETRRRSHGRGVGRDRCAIGRLRADYARVLGRRKMEHPGRAMDLRAA